MKKITAITITLLIFTVVAFAQTASVSGSAYMKWGADLDYEYTGFLTGLDQMNIIVSQPVDTSSASTISEEIYYGELLISGIRLEASTENDHDDAAGEHGIDDDENIAINNPDKWTWNPGVDVDLQLLWDAITAKIYLGPLTLQIYNNPANTKIDLNYSETWLSMLENAYNYDIFTSYYGKNDKSNQAHFAYLKDKEQTKYFVSLAEPHNYVDASGIMGTLEMPNLGTVQLMVNSMGKSWDVSNPAYANINNEYSAKMAMDITSIPNTKFQMAAAQGFNVDDPFTDMGIAAQYAMNKGEITLIPVVAADMALDSGDLTYAVTGGAKLSAMGTLVTAYAATNNFENIKNNIVYTVAMDMSSVENLIIQTAYEYYSYHGIHGKIGYAIPAKRDLVITPSAQISMDGEDFGSSKLKFSDMEVFIKGEILVEGLLDNTTFSLNYDSNEVTRATKKIGQLVFTTKLSF